MENKYFFLKIKKTRKIISSFFSLYNTIRKKTRKYTKRNTRNRKKSRKQSRKQRDKKLLSQKKTKKKKTKIKKPTKTKFRVKNKSVKKIKGKRYVKNIRGGGDIMPTEEWNPRIRSVQVDDKTFSAQRVWDDQLTRPKAKAPLSVYNKEIFKKKINECIDNLP